jgi:RHS repeat-associated protein
MVIAGSFRLLSLWLVPGRAGPGVQAAAMACAAALTVTFVGGEPAASAEPVAVSARAKAQQVHSRPDVVSARVTARTQGARVEIESLRDETSTTWVNPDGTMTTQAHGGTIRFKGANGQWRDVDLTMAEATDGTVAPKGHPAGLSLSGASKAAGGSAKGDTETDLAVARQGKGKRKQDRDVTLSWRGGKLGTPALSGTTATYKNVKPGVDLVVDARRTGYETHLVINTASALAALERAAKTKPLSWEIPVKTKGLSPRSEADGSVSFVDVDGQVASRVAAPVAWDAVVDEKTGNRVNESPVAMTVTQNGSGKAVLTLTPDQDWLTSADRVFPVTIDPTYASGTSIASFDSYVSSAFPTATYSTSTELRVGTYNGGGDKYRSFLTFPITGGIGAKDVVSASLSLYEFHSYSCTAKPFYVYSAYGGTSATNWNNQPAAPSLYGSLTAAKGYSSSCAAGRVSVPITSMIQSWAASGSSAGGLRLSASETDSYGWKKFYSVETSTDPFISYTYNRKPNVATTPTMDPAYTPSYVDPRDGLTYLFTSDSAPRFYSKATDPDGSTVSVTFEVHSSTAGTAASKVSSCATGYGASGASVYCSPTTVLANNTYYYARAAVQDDRHLWNGAWSAWTKFGTAYNAPPAPTLSCPGYADGAWTDNAPSVDIACTIKATGVANDWSTPGYLDLTVDGVAGPRQKITPTNDPTVVATTVTIPKTSNGSHIITATTVSRTLKTTSKTLAFGWGGASVSVPTVGTASSGNISVKAAGPPRGTSASVTGKVQWRLAGIADEATGWTDVAAPVVISAPSSTTPVSWASSLDLRDLAASARVPALLDVQVCFIYAGVSTPQCTWSQSPRSIMRLPHAFGSGYPTSDAGPGQVALFTGEFNTSATDVSVPGYSGDLALSRSHTSFDGDGTVEHWPTDPATGVFGPGWTASLQGPEAGAAGLQVIDNTRQDGTIVLVDEEGEPLVYQTPTKNRAYKVTVTGSTKSPYLPATSDTTAVAADLTITNATATAGTSMLMTLTEEDGTATTWAPVSYSTSADTDWVPVSVQEPGQVGKTTFVPAADGSGRVVRIIAPIPPNAAGTSAAVTCSPTAALVKGCRALDIGYATATTATAMIPGDFTGRVKLITATLWDPATSAMVTTTVASYKYDMSGRLLNVTDPRTSLGTDYTWDDNSTRLTSIKSTGLAAFRLSYDTTPGAPHLASISRDNAAGSGIAVILSRYNYAVSLSGAGLPDLSATVDPITNKVFPWYQDSKPVTGYAVFGADYTGAVSGAGADWSRAALQYADAQGYTVNTATYGAGAWQVSSTDYDAKGNIVRELDHGATKTVRDAATADEALAAGQVKTLSTETFYNSDLKDTTGKVVTESGILVTDAFGPVRNAWVNADTNNNGVAGDPDDVTPVRPHTRTTYDQGSPNVVNGVGINPATDDPYRLPTTVTVGVAPSNATPGQSDLETTSTTVNSYAKLDSTDTTEGDPWALGTSTKVTTAGIARTTRYDTEGKTTEARQPMSIGTDAGTTKTIYYTAYPNSSSDPATAICGNKVEWAGLVCRTLPAANPTAGAGGGGSLPDSRTTAYNAWLQPLTLVETSGGVTRTTQIRYDSAGRAIASWPEVAGLSGSTSRPGTFTHYLPTTATGAGLVDYVGNLNALKADAEAGARTSTTYDAWGRALTSTGDVGDITTTTYVAPGTPGAGNVATVADTKGTTAYSYDGTDAAGNTERRGMVTTQTVTRPGIGGALTFKAAYDADGKLVTQKLPGQVTQTTGYDAAGEPESLTYSGTVQPVRQSVDTNGDPIEDENGPVYEADGPALTNQPWLAWSVTNDAQGRVKSEFTGPAAGFDGNPGVHDPDDITDYDVSDAAIGYDRSYNYDAAGRLTSVSDHTATDHGESLDASPCVVRAYAFDDNGRRKTLTTKSHSDGDCAGTAGVTTTTTSFDNYDTADRPTLGQGGAGQYVYDLLGRQTTLPAVDSPAFADNATAGDITIAYFDDDLPRSLSQDGTTTVFTLDSLGRRTTATTSTASGTSTLVRHYTDQSDNPAWTEEDGAVTRYVKSLRGGLGATIGSNGAVMLALTNMRGDVLTNVPVAATAASDEAAAEIVGWSDYSEYGAPRDALATATVAGTSGYGWLGSEQRATTSESLGVTLMGRRLYNPTRGSFTALDPIRGGNETSYSYPNDPINFDDISGCRTKCRGPQYTMWLYQSSDSNFTQWREARLPNWYRSYSFWYGWISIKRIQWRWEAKVTYYRRCYAGYAQLKVVSQSFRRWRDTYEVSYSRVPGSQLAGVPITLTNRISDRWTGTSIYWS